MSDQISGQDSIRPLKDSPRINEDRSSYQQQGPSAHQPSTEDMSIESLSKEALAETLQLGGAFASDNSN